MAPAGARVAALEREPVVRLGLDEARAQLEVLAELIVKIGVLGIGFERQAEQALVAAGLARLLRIEIAVVADDERQAPARQRALGLLVDAPL